MSNYLFNYATFYNYYTNPNNVITDKNDCVKLLFFNKTKKVSDEKIRDEKCNYIIIDGVTPLKIKNGTFSIYNGAVSVTI